jgi:N5-(cytidine 5'-diphosphoramidyl)-L-glutamine hydrolase
MKIIAVSQRVEISKYKEIRPQLDINFFNFIVSAGYIPVPIPYYLYNKKKSNFFLKKWLTKIKPHGIVLSGGENIGTNKFRDTAEYFLINFSKKNHIPVLGICRGMQILSKYFGSKLFKVKNHVNKNHLIKSKDKKIIVNSFHNLAIKSCPKNFKIKFKAEDGVIESIYSTNSRMEGWMWHPERYKKFKSFDIKSFKHLFR